MLQCYYFVTRFFNDLDIATQHVYRIALQFYWVFIIMVIMLMKVYKGPQ